MLSWIPAGVCAIFIFSFTNANMDSGGSRINNSDNNFTENELFLQRYDTLAISPPLLQLLAEKEEIIHKLVQNYFDFLSNQSKTSDENSCHYQAVNRYLQHFEATTGSIKHDYMMTRGSQLFRPNLVIWNPLAVYQLLSRIRNLLQPVVSCLGSETGNHSAKSLRTQIIDALGSTGWPTEEDLRYTISSILRIQYVYDIPTIHLAYGWIDGSYTGISLSALDCNVIADQAMEEGEHAFALEWFEAAMYRYSIGDPFDVILPLNYTALVEKWVLNMGRYDPRHGSRWQIENTYHSVMQKGPIHRPRWRNSVIEESRNGPEKEFIRAKYWGVCSGKIRQAEAVKAKLFCYYETRSNPGLLINPLKVELLSLEPFLIIQYHSIVGDKLVEKVRSRVGFSLTKSTVVQDRTSVLSSHRTSVQSMFLHDEEFISVWKRVEMLTDLKLLGHLDSEIVQIASYSTGSHYSAHEDVGEPDASSPSMGERIASVLLYLSDVTKGGGTAFPQSHLLVPPVRGSAVLWYNLKANGEKDPFQWHGACPVIFGEKWIASKWVRSHSQMFTEKYKCDPNPNATFQVTANGRPVPT